MANQVAYGFMNLKDRMDELVTNVGIRVVTDGIRRTFEEHNRVMDIMLGMFTRRITDVQIRYKTPGVARLQPLDENGRARKIKAVGHYDVAFPLYRAGGAWGATWLEREKMTIEDANNTVVLLLTADVIWMRDRMFAALFQNASWQADDDDKGTLTIQPLANGDAVTYPYWSAGAFGGTDNHYLAQAVAIDDANNPFPTIYTELREHPENTGNLITFVPTNLAQDVQDLATFIAFPDGNIDPGSSAARLVGRPNFPDLPGQVLGYETSGRTFLVEWQNLPDDYMVTIVEGAEPVLGMREEELPQLRGFRQVAEREDHPFWESQWYRAAGFGGWNRVGAVVTRIGNASYAPPADYSLVAL